MDKKITIKYLNDIAKNYIHKYNLNINEVYITNDYINTSYHYNSDNKGYIHFSISHIKDISKYLKNRCKGIINDNIIIFALLHELYHAIDHQIYKRLDKDIQSVNFVKYNSSRKYHNSRPFEKRADKFARLEIKKWL